MAAIFDDSLVQARYHILHVEFMYIISVIRSSWKGERTRKRQLNDRTMLRQNTVASGGTDEQLDMAGAS